MAILDAELYLADTPPGFVTSADVLLVFADDKAARVYSQILASQSEFLQARLRPLHSGKAQEEKLFVVHLQDFTATDGLDVLKAVYAKSPFANIQSALTVALFAHQYSAKVLRKGANEYLAARVFLGQNMWLLPGATASIGCAYERALTWALEAEKLDLPRLSAQCERFLAMHWEHVRKYADLSAALSGAARE